MPFIMFEKQSLGCRLTEQKNIANFMRLATFPIISLKIVDRKSSSEGSSQQSLICTVDKYPKVSFEYVKTKMVVVEGSEVNYTVERFVGFS